MPVSGRGRETAADWVDAGLTRYGSGECVLWWHWSGWCPSAHSRGECRSDSRRALTRLRRAVECSAIPWGVMITLTYPRVWPGMERSKEDLRRFLRWLMEPAPGRSTWNKPGCVIWVCEWQARGAPHYHLICTDPTWIPHSVIARQWRSATLGGASLAAGTRIERLRSGSADLAWYLSKEMSKKGQKTLASRGWTGAAWGQCGEYQGTPVVAARMLGLVRTEITAMIWIRPLISGVRMLGPGWAWHRQSDPGVISALESRVRGVCESWAVDVTRYGAT